MKIFCMYTALSLMTLGYVGSSLAQQPAKPPAPTTPFTVNTAATQPAADQPSRDDVIKMMDAMHIHAQLESMTRTMNMQMKQQIRETLKGQTNLTPKQVAEFEEGFDKGASVYPISEMMDDMIPVYQRHMTKADIDAIVVFYSSPAGQHLLAEGPAIMKDSMGVLMPKVQTRTQAYMTKMKKEIDSAPPASPPAADTPVKPAANPPAN